MHETYIAQQQAFYTVDMFLSVFKKSPSGFEAKVRVP